MTNLLFTIALASIAYGCWLLHPAAPWIVCGGIVLSICVYGQLQPEIVEPKKPEKANDNA